MGYDDLIIEYLGIERCYEKIKKSYYWKGMLENIKKYIKLCDKCQKKEKL